MHNLKVWLKVQRSESCDPCGVYDSIPQSHTHIHLASDMVQPSAPNPHHRGALVTGPLPSRLPPSPHLLGSLKWEDVAQ